MAHTVYIRFTVFSTTSFPGSFISRPPPPKKDPGSGWSRASQNLGGCQNNNWGRGGWVENSLNRVYSGAENFDVKINISLMWHSTKSDSTWEGKCLTLWPLKKFMLPIRSQVAAGFVVLWEITAKIYSGKQIEHFFEQRKSCAAVRCRKGKTSRTWYADHAKDASRRPETSRGSFPRVKPPSKGWKGALTSRPLRLGRWKERRKMNRPRQVAVADFLLTEQRLVRSSVLSAVFQQCSSCNFESCELQCFRLYFLRCDMLPICALCVFRIIQQIRQRKKHFKRKSQP